MLPEDQLKHDLRERLQYWEHKSAKGGIAQPTVVAGVVASILDRVLVLFPKAQVKKVLVKKVLKRK